MGIIKTFYHRIHKGQSTVEFGVLLVVIVTALVAMQFYLRRGIQGRLRSGVDSLGEQYDPEKSRSEFTINHTKTGVKLVNVTTQNGWYTQQSQQNVTVSDTTMQTLYDNTVKNGYEIVDE
jgi:uncharacterized protein (UPF0333 family)